MPYKDYNKQIKNARQWAKANPDKRKHIESKYSKSEKGKRRRRCYQYRRLYGISLLQYEKLLKDQNYKCKLCGGTKTHNNSKYLTVDHCHDTGKIRGLLCKNCNAGLGQFGDNMELLEKAVQYLKESRNG